MQESYIISQAKPKKKKFPISKKAPAVSAPVHVERKRKGKKNTVEAPVETKVVEAPKSPVKENKQPEPVQTKKGKKSKVAEKEPEPVKQPEPVQNKKNKKKNNKSKTVTAKVQEVEAPSAVNDFDDGEEWVTVSKKTAGGVNTQKKGTNDDYLELF